MRLRVRRWREVEGLSKQKAKFREPGSQNPGTGKLKTGNREAKIREKKTGNREAKIREPGRKSFFSIFFGGRRGLLHLQYNGGIGSLLY